MDYTKFSNYCVRWTLTVLMSLCFYIPLSAQTPGWTVNPHDFQYHMSVYATLQISDETVSNTDRYELGAFVGDECRGIAVADSSQGHHWLYLRIWSNSTSDEKITLKIYDKEAEKTIDVTETFDFEHLGLIGEPSSPKMLTPLTFIPGDVNGDGQVMVNDVVLAINAVLGQASEDFVSAAADINGDGQIMVNDVVLMINIVLGVSPSASSVRSIIDKGITNDVQMP